MLADLALPSVASRVPIKKKVPLFLVAVPDRPNLYSFLVEDRPVELWAKTLQKNGDGKRFHFMEVPRHITAYLDEPPRDYLALLALSYGRGVMKSLVGDDFTSRPIDLLHPVPGVLHFEAHVADSYLIKRLIEETDERQSFGHAIAAIRVLGEQHGADVFPPLFP